MSIPGLARGAMSYPSRAFKRTPGYEWRRLKIRRPDGRSIDVYEARLLLPDDVRKIARHLGQAGGFHVFEWDPRKLRR